MSYAQHLAEHGGLATCGAGLGVAIGTDPRVTPPGWVYVALPTTAEFVEKALAHARLGRSVWPKKEVLKLAAGMEAQCETKEVT